MAKAIIKQIPMNPLKLLWGAIVANVGQAFLSKSQWSLRLFITKYLQVCTIHNFFLQEDVEQASIGFFNNTRHFTLYQKNILGVSRDVGRVLVMSDSETLDLTYVGSVVNLTPQQLQDIHSMFYMVANAMSGYFEDISYDISPEIDSFDIRFSKLKVVDLMAAVRAGALNLNG